MTLLRTLLLCTVLGSVSAAAADQGNLTLAIHPFKPPTELIDAFTPLANYLARRTDHTITIIISKSYQDHIDSIGKSGVDIAYVGPASYVKLRETYGPQRLLARQAINGQPTFHGKIFVRNDSSIHSLHDLIGKRFAFGDANSTMSFLVPYYMLVQAGVEREKLASAGTVTGHVNNVMAILAGDYDAGAVKEDVFYEYEKRGIRAIATSPPIADHVFVASDHLAEKTVSLLRVALLELSQQTDGAAILDAITPGVTALLPVNDEDYSNLRDILTELKKHGVEP